MAAETDGKSRRDERHGNVQAKEMPSVKHRVVHREGQISVEGRAIAGNGGVRQLGPARFANAQNGPPRALPAARSFAPNRPIARPLATMRHRGANPPVVGGIAVTSRGRAVALDGAGIHRKP
jgi:hypothetical protein